MNILRFFGSWLRSLLVALLTLALLAGIFLALRLTAPEQLDDRNRLQTKARYLEQIRTANPDLADAPNIIFFLYDDMGYGDIGAGRGNRELIRTPHIDRLAQDGVMLSDFHSPAPVCTPARAGYLTGRLPARAGMPNVVFPSGSTKELLFSKLMNPGANVRLPAEEITLADVLGAAGYRTGMVGKWHLGDRSPSLPNDMGFDSYFGALYSNDMEPFAYYRNRDIDIPAPVDQRYMTEIYTDEAIAFIAADRERPFFLYFAHNFPHRPLHVRDQRSGNSDAGLYGDVLEEIDGGVGRILQVLESSGQLDNTLILISSDNGPWFLGDAGGLRGRKGNTFEGGMRVPFIAHWPAAIPGGRIEPAMAMGTDLLPTVLEILGLPAPTDRAIDGRSILGVLAAGEATPHDYLYYYDGETLLAVGDQRFKYRGPASVHYGTDQMPMAVGLPQKEWLFDMDGDPSESYDTSDRHPQDLARLRRAFEEKNAEMSVNKRGWH